MENCLFCKIVRKEIPTKLLYEDEEVIAFNDIHPAKPVHMLIIPKIHIPELIAVQDDALYAKLFNVVKELILARQLQDKGYKVIVNGGGSQDVNHLHVHVMGPMGVIASE